MKLKSLLQQSWFWLLFAIAIFLINQLPFLTDIRPVMYDEAWYANTAYNFSIGNGFHNTAVGTRGNSNFFLPLLTGCMYWLFGSSLFITRLTAVLCGIMTLLFIHLALKELHYSLREEIMVYAFFLSIALFNTVYRFGRPECASLMCTAGGVWLAIRYLHKRSWGNIIGLSLFTLLSTISHPYSLLFYALLGIYLLYNVLKQHQWKQLAHLSLLLLSAIVGITLIAWVSYKYNGADENYVAERFSVSNILAALPVYLKSAFLSKHTLYYIPILIVLLLNLKNTDKVVRILSAITLIYFLIFPFLFSTDLMMIGLGTDYVMIIGTILLAPFLDKVFSTKHPRLCITMCLAYCTLNLGLSYYYNYSVKYERCNTVLEREIGSIIEKDAVVFGPIRQWFTAMETHYYSDHYCFELPDSFDYIILNIHDKDIYDNSITISQQLDSYTLIYERPTKQYGIVQVYKNKCK